MSMSLEERYQFVSRKIESEEMDEFARMAGILAGFSPAEEETGDTWEHTRREHTAIVSLHALRIQIVLEMIKNGNRDRIQSLREDFKKVRHSINVLHYDWNDEKAYYAETLDAILLIRPHNRALLMKQLPLSVKMKIKASNTLSPDIYNILKNMSRYYLENNFRREGQDAIRNLVRLSQERNAGDPSVHRYLVKLQLDYLDSSFPELTAELCREQSSCFHGVQDSDAAWFYWYWACALLTLDDPAAKSVFLTCSQICFALEGEDSWLGSLSKQHYCTLALFNDNEADKEDYLWEFLHKLDGDHFSQPERMFSRVLAGQVRYRLLHYNLDRLTLKNHLNEIRLFVSFCRDFDADPQYPLFKLRMAYNLLSAYYLETGEFLQAADAAVSALESVPPEGTDVIVDERHIYSNLILLYCIMGDLEQVAHYRDALAEHMNDEDISNKDYFRYLTLIGMADTKLGIVDEGDLDSLKDDLHAIYQGIQDGYFDDPHNRTPAIVVWIINTITTVNDAFQTTREEFAVQEGILRYILDHLSQFSLLDIQIALVYMELARIYWLQEDSLALEYLKQCLFYSRENLPHSESQTTILRIAALISSQFHHTADAVKYANEALAGITTAWQKATACLNDHRVCQMLSFALSNQNALYPLLRPHLSPADRYAHILKYKDLPSLVGRERNRILRSCGPEDPLRSRIFSLQDRIAEIEAGNALRGSDDMVALRDQLRHLETEYAKKFPAAGSFTDISLARVADSMADGTAILEYYCALGDSVTFGKPHQEISLQIEAYVITKTAGTVRLHTFTVSDAFPILEDCQTFVAILQQEASLAESGRKEILRAGLYRSLVAPALAHLDGIQRVYLAPDSQLCNLPFEILSADGGPRLDSRFSVVRLVSGRDLLFYDDRPCRGGTLIVGAPNYEALRGEGLSDATRNADLKLEPVAPLPFSHIEARAVGRRCRAQAFTGSDATKYVLQNAGPCRIIHLATHGYFDRSLESDSLYSSCLVFAGANQWLAEGMKTRHFGNGILTADEISRMDLRNTELVVLSACRSSLEDTSTGTSQGLISGFSAAGVRWTVSHMWRAADFSTPILMDAFYDAFLNRGMDVPEALQYGKDRLRSITVAELRREGWLTPDPQVHYREEDLKLIRAISGRSDRNKPFADEYFWSGFVCHKFR